MTYFITFFVNHISGEMVSMPVSNEVDGFQPWSGKTKDYKIGIYCFSSSIKDKNLLSPW